MKRAKILVAGLAVSILSFIVSGIANGLPEQRIYKNDKLSITFSYPAMLELNEGPTEEAYTVFMVDRGERQSKTVGLLVEGPQDMIVIHSFAHRDYQEEIARVLSNVPMNRKISDVTFKGYPAKEIRGNLEQFGVILNSKNIVVDKDGMTYTLGVEWHANTKIEGYFDELIRSLEFIR
jgi:hypothetical protein